MNHIMFGEIGAWLYKAPGGIKPDENQPGFKHVLLEPHFMEGLSSFEANHEGPYGKITSSWARDQQHINYKVSIPANSSATVKLPSFKGQKIYLNGKLMSSPVFNLNAGNHEIRLER
ncbi:alpha-L-rhamnosidase C-terminal domain-containing protein [Pedobacter sp. UC225_65]|uniref:alpha-L-rhamnosidase C-terminal domain-containing protein n=1 Tax=Pedobacter sp. UC225_65 TaxID=3350173 RepID=UPI00367195F6